MLFVGEVEVAVRSGSKGKYFPEENTKGPYVGVDRESVGAQGLWCQPVQRHGRTLVGADAAVVVRCPVVVEAKVRYFHHQILTHLEKDSKGTVKLCTCVGAEGIKNGNLDTPCF